MKSLSILLILCVSLGCYKAGADKALACDKALELCNNLVIEQDRSILLLKDQVSNLEHRLEAEQNSGNLPAIYYIILGVALGSTITYTIIH